MYSAMILSVVSERLRLMISLRADMAIQSELVRVEKVAVDGESREKWKEYRESR